MSCDDKIKKRKLYLKFPEQTENLKLYEARTHAIVIFFSFLILHFYFFKIIFVIYLHLDFIRNHNYLCLFFLLQFFDQSTFKIYFNLTHIEFDAIIVFSMVLS